MKKYYPGQPVNINIQSLGHPESRALNCPLFEVGTPPPHNSDMAYGLETGNNNIQSLLKISQKNNRVITTKKG